MAKKKISLVEANARIEHAKFQLEQAKATCNMVNKDLETILDPELVLAEVSTEHVVWTLGNRCRAGSRNNYCFFTTFQLFEIGLYPSDSKSNPLITCNVTSNMPTYRPTLRVIYPINKIQCLVTNGPQVNKLYQSLQKKMKQEIQREEYKLMYGI